MSFRPRVALDPPPDRLKQVLSAGLERRTESTGGWGVAQDTLDAAAQEWQLTIEVQPKTSEAPGSQGADGNTLEVNGEAYRVDFRLEKLGYMSNRRKFGEDLLARLNTVFADTKSVWQPLWRKDSYTCGNPEVSYYHIVAMTKEPATDQVVATMNALGLDFSSDRLVEELQKQDPAWPYNVERVELLSGETKVVAVYALKHKDKAAKQASREGVLDEAEKAARELSE